MPETINAGHKRRREDAGVPTEVHDESMVPELVVRSLRLPTSTALNLVPAVSQSPKASNPKYDGLYGARLEPRASSDTLPFIRYLQPSMTQR